MFASLTVAVATLVGAPQHAELDFTKYTERPPVVTVHVSYEFVFGRDLYRVGMGDPNAHDLPDMIDNVFDDLVPGGKVEYKIVGRKVRIFGVRGPGDTYRPITYASIRVQNLPLENTLVLSNPRPKPVEFHFRRIPLKPEQKARIKLDVASIHNDVFERVALEYTEVAKRSDLAAQAAAAFAKAGMKAEADGEMIRVYGWEIKGKLVPAARAGGSFTGLKGEERPTALAWPLEPCVVLDFSTVRRDVRATKLSVEITTVPGGETFREELPYGGMFEVKDLAKLLLQQHFKIEVEGDVIRVYGWLDKVRKLSAPTGASMKSRDLKDDELPKVRFGFKP